MVISKDIFALKQFSTSEKKTVTKIRVLEKGLDFAPIQKIKMNPTILKSSRVR